MDERAVDDLRFIRETMAQSVRFTDVPGRGMVLMGLTAIVASLVADMQASTDGWLVVWGVAAAIAMTVGLTAAFHKARQNGSHLLAAPAKKFLLGLTPSLVAGALLTALMQREGMTSALPATWLLLYGTAVVAAGTFSISIVPLGGLCFMVLGGVALFVPAGWGNWLLATGFGGLNIAFGLVIVRRYGG